LKNTEQLKNKRKITCVTSGKFAISNHTPHQILFIIARLKLLEGRKNSTQYNGNRHQVT